MGSEEGAVAWAEEEYGLAKLGNTLRTRRLVKLAGRLAESPAGLVTGVFNTGASRTGAYRFLESQHVDAGAVVSASAEATIRRAGSDGWMFAPMDGSSLSLADPYDRRGLGRIGTHRRKGRGLKCMSCIGVRLDGTPLGLLGMAWWNRGTAIQEGRKDQCRPIEEKETRFWLSVLNEVNAAFVASSSRVRPWYQLDRGADFHELLAYMVELGCNRITVRATQNRRTADAQTSRLWDTVLRLPAGPAYQMDVSGRAACPGQSGRQARAAKMVLRWGTVHLPLRERSANSRNRYRTISLQAVLALEEGTTPSGEDPIQWLLLTNAPVTDAADAALAVFGYSLRWRIEDFHRTWKSNCNVEATLLRSPDPIIRWATLHAAVAMRTERLKHLARESPEEPATLGLSRDEIDAIIVLRQPPNLERGDTPSIALAVRWIADIGGYVGPSNGPPGSTVISRGLERVEVAAITLRNLASPKPD